MSRKSIVVACITVGFIFGCAVLAIASGGFHWADLYPLDQSITMSSETFETINGQDVNRTIVSATRGPLTAGTFQIQATVTTYPPFSAPALVSARLLHGQDSDSSGVIEASEWTVAAATTATTDAAGVTTAQLPSTVVPAGEDGYRIEFTWADGTTVGDDILRKGLTAP